MSTADSTDERLVTRSEIVELTGVARPTITMWAKRHTDFPSPVRSGEAEYFWLPGVLEWLDSRAVPEARLTRDERSGVTYGSRARQRLRVRRLLDVEAGVCGRGTEPEDAGNRQCVDELMGELADRVRGSGSMVDYLSLLLSLNFLRLGEPGRWSALREVAASGRGAEAAGTLLRHIGVSADEVLRRRGLPPGMRDAFVKLEPGSYEVLLRVVHLVEGLGRDAFRLVLDEYEAQAGLRSSDFFTPRGLARLMARLVVRPDEVVGTVHDPYARGGEMLAAAARAVSSADPHSPPPVVIGESPSRDTLRLASMNLTLQGIRPKLRAVTASPWRRLERAGGAADVVLTNPPFNMSDSAGQERGGTWQFGPPPGGNDNFAWLQHVVALLSADGRAAVVMPNKAGNSTNRAERRIRRNMVEAGVVEAVIALPPKLFSQTPIPVSVWLLRKSVSARQEVLFLDARNLGTEHRGRRVMDERDQQSVVEAYERWCADDQQSLAPGDFGCLGVSVPRSALRDKGYTLNPLDHLAGAQRESSPAQVPDALVEARADTVRLRMRVEEADRAADAIRAAARSGEPGRRGPAPAGWTHVFLRDLCQIQAGFSYSRLPAEQRASGEQNPVVFSRHLRNGRIGEIIDERVSAETARRLERFRLTVGDIVCIRTGAMRPPAIVTRREEGWLLSTNLIRLRVLEPARVDPEYLLGYLSLPHTVGWITDRAAATAAPSINAASLGQLLVALPPLQEQLEVAATLRSLDEQIAAHQQLVASVSRTRAVLAEHLMSAVLALE
ncbi:N-6 DNA methylase [Kitasatospora sp. NPDC056531]|uniref:N-6 DNA methylase n=1 Tax=Kitasatospora sp. NPDC056531 TaxID=3345856 RepID=UPI0036848CCB